MKNKILFFCFSILVIGLTSCPQEQAPVLEGFHFNEEEFIVEKQKWKDANAKNYSFRYEILFGGWDTYYAVAPFEDIVVGRVTVKNGIPYENHYEINGRIPHEEREGDILPNDIFLDEEVKRLQEEYNITSCAILTLDDFFRFIEERVEIAKKRYDSGKCSYYEASIYSYGSRFEEWYCFTPNKKTRLQHTFVRIDDFTVQK